MTPEDAAEEAKRIMTAYSGDTEALHGKLDDLLCIILNDAGYTEVVGLFETAEKWYA